MEKQGRILLIILMILFLALDIIAGNINIFLNYLLSGIDNLDFNEIYVNLVPLEKIQIIARTLILLLIFILMYKGFRKAKILMMLLLGGNALYLFYFGLTTVESVRLVGNILVGVGVFYLLFLMVLLFNNSVKAFLDFQKG